jgi:hypothetical protein
VALELKAGTALSYSVSGTPDGSTYTLYYVLERLDITGR